MTAATNIVPVAPARRPLTTEEYAERRRAGERARRAAIREAAERGVPYVPKQPARLPRGADELPSVERLREVLAYNPDTGSITWRVDRGSARAGTVAGTLHPTGYRVIRVNGKFLLAHRVALALANGSWPDPELEVDHLNGDRADNRIANLRLADAGINAQNQRGLRVDNSSGYSGVDWYAAAGKWRARARLAGRRHYIGLFEDPAAASAAVEAYKAQHCAGFTGTDRKATVTLRPSPYLAAILAKAGIDPSTVSLGGVLGVSSWIKREAADPVQESAAMPEEASRKSRLNTAITTREVRQ